jgi:hypothetical protein
VKAIIVRSPWIEQILSGEKTWEMRSSRTTYRGRVGLIQKGTGLVVGAARLVDSLAPIDAKTFGATWSKHRIPDNMCRQAFEAGWIYPWVIEACYRLTTPVFAGQRRGQVIWVPLTVEVADAVRSQAPAGVVRSGWSIR